MTVPIRLTPRGWRFLIAAAAVSASWLVIGLRDLWYLVSLLAAMVLLAVVWVLVLPFAARFEVRASASDPTPTAGDSVALTAIVRNRAVFAIRCGVVWEVGGESRELTVTVDPADPAVSTFEWEAKRRGSFTARVRELVLFDPLGLATCRVRSGSAVELLVLPRKLDDFFVELRRAGRAAGIDGFAGSSTMGGDAGERAGTIRAYRSGDPLRLIHWKQSARQGELLVNLRESAGVSERSLMLVVAREGYGSEHEFDLAVSAAATLGSHWLDEGHPVRLTLDSPQAIVCANEAEMLRTLARARMVPNSAAVDVSAVFPGPQAVVTGTLGPRLADQLGRAEGQGVLLAFRMAAGTAPPRHWRALEIPLPELEPAGDASRGVGVGRRGAR